MLVDRLWYLLITFAVAGLVFFAASGLWRGAEGPTGTPGLTGPAGQPGKETLIVQTPIYVIQVNKALLDRVAELERCAPFALVKHGDTYHYEKRPGCE